MKIFKISNIFNLYKSFDTWTKHINYAYCKKVWFWFLNGVVLPGV